MSDRRTPGEVAAQRLRQLRTRHDWNQEEEVASRMQAFGFHWLRQTVTKVENGTREIGLDELVGLAFVLGVSPVSLLVPEGEANYALTPTTTTPTMTAWQWMTGNRAMVDASYPGEIIQPEEAMSRSRFYLDAAPDSIRTAYERSEVLREMHSIVNELITAHTVPQEVVSGVRSSVLRLLEDLMLRTNFLIDKLRGSK